MAEPRRLGEPDLAYYLTLRAQAQAAQVQATTLAQAVQSLLAVTRRRYNLPEQTVIDAHGFIIPGTSDEEELLDG